MRPNYSANASSNLRSRNVSNISPDVRRLVQYSPWQPKTDERIIPMSPPLRQILEAQQRDRLSDRFVFPNTEGHRNTHLLEKFRRLCRKAGIRNSTVHALRHSFGAHLRMAGVNLADIGDLLGHRDLATTQIYAKVQQEHLRKMVSKLTPLITEVADDSGSRLRPRKLRTDPRATTQPSDQLLERWRIESKNTAASVFVQIPWPESRRLSSLAGRDDAAS
ncbi:MAG TPA: tyrosine-type recombinase/integrase [Acidimicrobiales bacterium]|nr:tyrosine-type recombinase/integrase [Acidimicrobiales bacterium]